jgi:hypothetical protein
MLRSEYRWRLGLFRDYLKTDGKGARRRAWSEEEEEEEVAAEQGAGLDR